PLDGRRRQGPQRLGLELLAVAAVEDPGAGRLDVFADLDARHDADDGDQPAPPAHGDTEHGEAGVGVMKGNPLDAPGKSLGHEADCTATPPGDARIAGPAREELTDVMGHFLKSL